MMAVSIKEEGILLLEPPADFVTRSNSSERTEAEAEDEVDVEDVIKATGPRLILSWRSCPDL